MRLLYVGGADRWMIFSCHVEPLYVNTKRSYLPKDFIHVHKQENRSCALLIENVRPNLCSKLAC